MTIDVADQQPTPPVLPVASKGPFQRIAGALSAPAETFEDIARKPDILVPLLVLLVIGFITGFIIVHYMDFNAMLAAQAEAMRAKSPGMSEADLERVGKMTTAFAKVMGYVGPLLTALWYVILSGVLLLACRAMGGGGTYKQAFSATLYSQFPLAINSIILGIVAAVQKSVDPTQMATVVKSNPAFLVEMKEHPVLFSLLSSVDLFTIWTVILLIFGFAALSRMPKAKTAGVVIFLWIVMILAKVGFAAMGAAKAGA